MAQTVNTQIARDHFRDLLDNVAARGTRYMITRYGKEVAALVPAAELRALERADNSRMVYHENREQARLREIRWLKEGLDGARMEARDRDTG